MDASSVGQGSHDQLEIDGQPVALFGAHGVRPGHVQRATAGSAQYRRLRLDLRDRVLEVAHTVEHDDAGPGPPKRSIAGAAPLARANGLDDHLFPQARINSGESKVMLQAYVLPALAAIRTLTDVRSGFTLSLLGLSI